MKFLESPMQTMAVGFALAMVLIMGYLGYDRHGGR